ncbi:MAG TPA: L-seryl-tRNA(Sec) selenium transferase, partial [Candidatus Dormibacteraeota bacterium]|nr:L-seryl-tRNA(Sec) selenium transferase [Candidatus Dormibacteraeota bacterium]
EALRLQTLTPAINATGILIHTNLGRAPLASEALDAVARLARGYSNLEYDLETGERGSRHAHVSGLLNELTGAQDSLVVNNCAAAVLLVLDTFAKGREVVVARSELVEIGGGFRVPEVLERSGASLVEVGTTNRVYIEDFERALSPRTALLLRTHPSNYRIEGFTHETSARELAELGRRAGVPVAEDLGSGALADLREFGAQHERTVQEALADGMGLVTFSGDKLLGGPQAGVIVGRAPLMARLRNNPLLRALRVDKMTLAALGSTLLLHRSGLARERIPLYRMLTATLDELRARAQSYVESVANAMVVDSEAYVGGGALPQSRIASIAVAIPTAHPDELAARLRAGEPPIVARIDDDRILFDLRTIAREEDTVVMEALKGAGTRGLSSI